MGYTATDTNASESITLPFKPVVFDYSAPDSSTDPVQCWVNGVSINADQITQSNGEVEVSPVAPAPTFVSGDYIGIFYETDYESTTASSVTC